MVNYTNDDVILYIHNELPTAKLFAFENALTTNWALREKVELLSSTSKQLQKISLTGPSKRTLNSIMEYATRGLLEKV